MPTTTTNRDEWLRARLALLEREKAHLRAGDEIAALRRALPWLRVDAHYEFDSPSGRVALADLFEGRSQLIVQHFMFGIDADVACPICSFWADGYDPMIVHMNQRDASFVAVSRAPLAKIEAYRRRMGWRFRWVSSFGSSFNVDFGVSPSNAEIAAGTMRYNYRDAPLRGHEAHGVSVFARNAGGAIFHTYSTYARGLDPMNAAYAYLDLTPKGRDESDLPWSMAWVKRHDEYANAGEEK